MSLRGRRATSQLVEIKETLNKNDEKQTIVFGKKPFIDYHQVALRSNNRDYLRIEDMTSRDRSKDEYADHNLCQELFKDESYMWCYRHAIVYNKHLFKDKIVVDLFCGSGILSMWCAKAGARHIYAIHDSAVTQLTERVVRDNKLSDVITVIRGKVDDIELPVEKVDIIVSTVFGQTMFCETELMTLIEARDKWLKPDGILLPDKCTMHIAAIEEKEGRKARHYWNNVYGFDMKPMYQAVDIKPMKLDIEMSQVVSASDKLKELDFYTMKNEDFLETKSEFKLKMLRSESIEALLVFFTVEFRKCHIPIIMTTAPNAPKTRWGQTVFFINFRENFVVQEGEEATGEFHKTVNLGEYDRLSISIDLKFLGKSCIINGKHNYIIK